MNYATIHEAAKQGDLADIDRHLQNGASLNAMNKDGMTPLMLAAAWGHLDVVKFLVDKDANLNAMNKNGATLLMGAAFGGYKDVAKFLVENGTDVNARDNNGLTPLMSAAFKGHMDLVIFLVENGADVNARDNNGVPALICAEGNGHLNVVKFLRQHGAIACLVATYKTIHGAASKGDLADVERHLQQGADVNALCDSGWTPLMWASRNGHLDVVKLLVNKGANVNARDKTNFTPLKWAAHFGKMASAVMVGQDLFKNTTARTSPLMLAAAFGNLEVVKYLVGKGADVNARDDNTMTPLKYAEFTFHLDVAEFLKQRDAK